MEKLHKDFQSLKKKYDGGASPLREIGLLAEHCLVLLGKASRRYQGAVSGKAYDVFTSGPGVSRPILPKLFIADRASFGAAWDKLMRHTDGSAHRITLDSKKVAPAVYTAINAACACYDLWKPNSRKTPGTIFEVLLGSLLGTLLPAHERTKAIPLFNDSGEIAQAVKVVEEDAVAAATEIEPGEADLVEPGGDAEAGMVSTDIVFSLPSERRGLVFPAKTTTRERIVQPFAHQRILDSVFGRGAYRSILLCVSELQRDENNSVKEICVPGTVRLFQRHLAPMAGIFYLDPPARYLQDDVTSVIPVGSLAEFLTGDLAHLV